MKKSMKMKKLVLAKETMGSLLTQASGGVTALAACSPTWNCTSPDFCQSGKYPC